MHWSGNVTGRCPGGRPKGGVWNRVGMVFAWGLHGAWIGVFNRMAMSLESLLGDYISTMN